jgi:hypothetical protein
MSFSVAEFNLLSEKLSFAAAHNTLRSSNSFQHIIFSKEPG